MAVAQGSTHQTYGWLEAWQLIILGSRGTMRIAPQTAAESWGSSVLQTDLWFFQWARPKLQKVLRNICGLNQVLIFSQHLRTNPEFTTYLVLHSSGLYYNPSAPVFGSRRMWGSPGTMGSPAMISGRSSSVWAEQGAWPIWRAVSCAWPTKAGLSALPWCQFWCGLLYGKPTYVGM